MLAGVHTGKAEDPRVTLIEFVPKYVVYWKHTVSTAGFVKEIGMAAATGKVATTGLLRELTEQDLEWGAK